MIGFEITESNDVIIFKIMKTIAKVVNSAIRMSLKPIKNEVVEIVGRLIRDTKEYNELMSGGTLAGEMGIPAGQGDKYVAPIIDAVLESLDIRYIPIRVSGIDNLIGGLEILILESSLNDVFKLETDNPIISERTKELWDWLHWLLEKGDKTISKYEIEMGSSGRSGLARMNVSKTGGFWRVPPHYSGSRTLDHNFLTIALSSDEMQNGLFSIIRKNVESAVQ